MSLYLSNNWPRFKPKRLFRTLFHAVLDIDFHQIGSLLDALQLARNLRDSCDTIVHYHLDLHQFSGVSGKTNTKRFPHPR